MAETAGAGGTGKERSPALPNVPTVAETVPGEPKHWMVRIMRGPRRSRLSTRFIATLPKYSTRPTRSALFR